MGGQLNTRDYSFLSAQGLGTFESTCAVLPLGFLCSIEPEHNYNGEGKKF